MTETVQATKVVEDNVPEDSDTARVPMADFPQVTTALTELRNALDTVVTADEAHTQSMLATVRAQFPSMQAILGELISSQTGDLRKDVDAAFEAIATMVRERLEPHKDAPEQLERHRDEVNDTATKLEALIGSVKELIPAEGWEGDAAESYRQAAGVQAKALEEFAGLNVSAANALDRAALLHRAAFLYSAEAIKFTTEQIVVVPETNPWRLHTRSRGAIAELRVLVGKLDHELSEIQDGEYAKELADEVERALDLPKVLTPAKWPTGVEAPADPAPTRDAVRPCD